MQQPVAPKQRMLNTLLLRVALVLIPALIGVCITLAHARFSPRRVAARLAPAPDPTLPARLLDPAVTNLADLMALRLDARNAGLETDGIDLRIWAAHATRPPALIRVAPPQDHARWNWHLDSNGRHALAVSIGMDSLDRRRVGLYDLLEETWVWTNTLPWPDTHESPHVFGQNLVVRFIRNAARFALEINPAGQIIALDRLPPHAVVPSPERPAPRPDLPGQPVAVRHGLIFVVDPDDQGLTGYPLMPLPGLFPTGIAPIASVFSGNGLLKFRIGNGRITVTDSLTRTLLQDVEAWKAPNTSVTGALTTRDGGKLSVYLETAFPGVSPTLREWTLAFSTYAGTTAPSFNPDALLSRPRQRDPLATLSRDGRWRLTATPKNELILTAQPEQHEIARLPLGDLLDLSEPIDQLAFLEEGRHIMIRQQNRFWLLDFAAARGYANLLARLDAAERAPVAAPPAAEQAEPATDPQDALDDYFYLAAMKTPDLPSLAPLALRAERLALHQAWFYAARLLDRFAENAVMDSRSPRINPLLRARAHFLAGQPQEGREVCRRALNQLATDTTAYNRMIRYQLQGLLFAADEPAP